MRITASDIYNLYKPDLCERRLYLRAQEVQEYEPDPFTQLLFDLGKNYESMYLQSLGDYEDVSQGSFEERFQNTMDLISKKTNVLYQPLFKANLEVKSENIDIIGIPDFLIRSGDNYIIRDCKISRSADERKHPEILRQLDLYGWLYEKCVGKLPAKLEVYLGNGELIEHIYDGGATILILLGSIADYFYDEHYSPVGWSKCGNCGFREHCWPFAVEKKDVATLPNVDKGLAIALRDQGIYTFDQLKENFTESELAEFKRPWGTQQRRVGSTAKSIFRSIEAITQNKVIKKDDFNLPESDNYVIFDLEGIPPQLDEVEKVYLWGLKIFNAKPCEYRSAVSQLGPEGDRQGWKDFLDIANNIFTEYGDIPFIHWASYEKSKLRLYIERYGDPKGIANRVSNNLCDLYVATQKAFILPTYSYSLKELEALAGYERSMEEYGGDWAMVQYIRAVESNNVNEYEKFVGEIIQYNKEDLEATWVVVKWLKNL